MCPWASFDAAWFTVQHVRAVGQDVSFGKCVLFSTSKAVRSVELDVRDLGGHLDFTWLATAGTLTRRVKEATHGVAAVGALPWGFRLRRVWSEVSICQLGCVLLKRLMCPPPLLVLFVLLL